MLPKLCGASWHFVCLKLKASRAPCGCAPGGNHDLCWSLLALVGPTGRGERFSGELGGGGWAARGKEICAFVSSWSRLHAS